MKWIKFSDKIPNLKISKMLRSVQLFGSMEVTQIVLPSQIRNIDTKVRMSDGSFLLLSELEWLDESPAPLDDTFTFECKDPNCKHCAYDDEEALTPVSQPNGDKVAKEALIEKPVGDFIFEQNTPHIMLWNGAHYHYSDVCTLLKKYRQPEIDTLREEVKRLKDENDIHVSLASGIEGAIVDITQERDRIKYSYEMAEDKLTALDKDYMAMKKRVEELEVKYKKCIDTIKRFDAGIIGMYNL